MNTSALRTFNYERSALLTLGLVALLGALVVGYVLSATALMRADYALQSAREGIAEAKEETARLQIRFSEVGSLQQIMERSASLAYTPVETVHYIERSTLSAFAVR